MCASRARSSAIGSQCMTLNLQTVHEHHRPFDIVIPVGVMQANAVCVNEVICVTRAHE